MRWLQITSVVVSALFLFGCSDDSDEKGQNPGNQDKPNPCEESCSGVPSCLNDSTIKKCKINEETGCAEWVDSTCPEDTSCQDGACTPKDSCQKECTDSPSCLNEATLKECKINEETGCVEWVESTCPEDTSCQNGACNPKDSCQKECTDSPACLNEATRKECKINEETGCAEWVESPCPENTSCQNGACEPKSEAPACSEECTVPDCADEISYRKCEKNENGCMVLSAPIACDKHQICKDGACVPDGNIYLENLNRVMHPFWNNTQMFEETVMFLDVGNIAQMLYNVDAVAALTSYDGTITYTGGVDYTVIGGKLQTLTNAIPHITSAYYYNPPLDPNGNNLLTLYNGQQVYTYCGDETAMTKWQVKVTYNHSDTWNGFKQPSYHETFAKFIQKLKNKEDVKIIFYGDSITFGMSASYTIAKGFPDKHYFEGVETLHPYTMLFTEALADLFGYKVVYQYNGLGGTFGAMPETYHPENTPTITYINSAVGGWTMADGVNNFETFITPYAENCDLFVLAFGMNDHMPFVAPEVSAANAAIVNERATAIMNRMHELSPNVSEVIVSTMLVNPNAVLLMGVPAIQLQHETAFANGVIPYMQSQGVPIAMSQMGSTSQSILSRKEYKDFSGNNVNHTNDFFTRVYAQTLLQTVIGYENMK